MTAESIRSPDEILRLRLTNQHLARPRLTDPASVVAHLGAVQAQDYPAAKWALGQRLCQASDDTIERAFAEGVMLRTHVLRPTWHFVAAADIRWMLALTAPRIKRALAANDRASGVDAALLDRSTTAIRRALEGGRQLTRPELGVALQQAGIPVSDGGMLGLIVAHAELDAVVCSGAWRGKQLTYALLDERVPPAHEQARDEALAELTTRFFTSHGPATLRDFTWWSGLTVADAKRGLEVGHGASRLVHDTFDGLTYWYAPAAAPPASDTAYLLPNYDEYTVAYRDRDLFYSRAQAASPERERREDVPFGNVIVVGGRVAGMWRRTLRGEHVRVDARWFGAPAEADRLALSAAAERLGAFLGRTVEVAVAVAVGRPE